MAASKVALGKSSRLAKVVLSKAFEDRGWMDGNDDDDQLFLPKTWDVEGLIHLHAVHCWRCRFVLLHGWRAPGTCGRPRRRRADPGE
jgi:hypothetical protein